MVLNTKELFPPVIFTFSASLLAASRLQEHEGLHRHAGGETRSPQSTYRTANNVSVRAHEVADQMGFDD